MADGSVLLDVQENPRKGHHKNFKKCYRLVSSGGYCQIQPVGFLKHNKDYCTKREALVSQHLKDLNHPNVDSIPRSYPINSENKGVQREAAVVPLATSDLVDIRLSEIKNQRSVFTDKQRFKLATDMLCGLSAIHEKGLVHQDIKPDNILIYESEGGYSSKISDCGDVQTVGELRTSGTPDYYPPEVKETYRARFVPRLEQNQDVFSMGISISVLLNPIWLNLAKSCGIQLPQDIRAKLDTRNLLTEDDLKSLDDILSGKLSRDNSKLMTHMQNAAKLCNRMCSIDPEQRPKVATIHTQFKKIHDRLPG